MVLAAFGTELPERELQANARMERRGVHIAELERLARSYDLVAEIRVTTIDDLRRLLRQGKLPIAFIDRTVFDLTPAQRVGHSIHHAKLHTVIPTRITSRYIRLHDPLAPHTTRRSIRLFRQAHELLGSPSVVCSKPEVGSL